MMKFKGRLLLVLNLLAFYPVTFKSSRILPIIEKMNPFAACSYLHGTKEVRRISRGVL